MQKIYWDNDRNAWIVENIALVRSLMDHSDVSAYLTAVPQNHESKKKELYKVFGKLLLQQSEDIHGLIEQYLLNAVKGMNSSNYVALSDTLNDLSYSIADAFLSIQPDVHLHALAKKMFHAQMEDSELESSAFFSTALMNVMRNGHNKWFKLLTGQDIELHQATAFLVQLYMGLSSTLFAFLMNLNYDVFSSKSKKSKKQYMERFLDYSPIKWLRRRAINDIKISDISIRKGELMYLRIKSEDREQSFVEYAFGDGPQRCIGKHLIYSLSESYLDVILPMLDVNRFELKEIRMTDIFNMSFPEKLTLVGKS